MQTWRNGLNKIVDKQKKKTLHETGSSAVTDIALEREEKKRKQEKKKLVQHGVFVFGHPSKYEPRRA